MKPEKLLRSAAGIVIIFLNVSCAAGVIQIHGNAELKLSLTIPAPSVSDSITAGMASFSRLISPATTSVRVKVVRSGTTVADKTFPVAPNTTAATLTVSDIPVSEITAAVTVSCLNSSGTVLSEASASILINQTSGVSLSLLLVPTALAGTAIDLGALASYAQSQTLTATAGGSSLYRITTTDSLSEYAVSVGLTSGTAIFYNADGTTSAKIGGTPEQWTVMTFGGSTPAYLMLTAPSTGTATATLGVEKAVYVTPSGSGTGSKASPLNGAALNTSYAGFSAPARFLLAAGDYPGKFNILNLRSLYGGFSSSFSARDIAANTSRFTGTFVAGTDQILNVSGVTYVALDGITLSPNLTAENGTTVLNYATLRVANSGIRISGCVIYAPGQELVFGFTTSGNVLNGVSITGQATGMPIILNDNTIVGAGTRWNLGANSGASTATVNMVSIGTSTASILLTGNVIDAGWETDTALYNTPAETANAVYINGPAPWLIGNTIASAGGASTINTFTIAGIRGTASMNGYMVNNFLFALKEYQAANAETNLLYILGSTFQMNLLTYNFLSTMYQTGRNSLYYNTVTRAQTAAALNSVSTGSGTASNNDADSVNSATYATYKTALDTLMVDFDGPTDDRTITANHNFKLKSTAWATLRAGGLDLSVSANLPSGFPTALSAYLLYDRGGNLRTSGSWSMGAYQYGY